MITLSWNSSGPSVAVRGIGERMADIGRPKPIPGILIHARKDVSSDSRDQMMIMHVAQWIRCVGLHFLR